MTNNYMIGCNYWDSVRGTNMWRDWDQSIVERDLAALADIGVKWMRIFPNWRDFQPVMILYGGRGSTREYRLVGEKLTPNEFYIDPVMIERFLTFCDIAHSHGMKLSVAILTGWMSGSYYCPPAFEGKNPYNNFEVLKFEQLFVRGFVRMVKHHPAIAMWGLGNESNNMGHANDRFEAYNWTAMVRNAILAEDQTRKIASGMHGMDVSGDPCWKVEDQGALTDILTPHPYPSPTIGAIIDPANTFRTTIAPTAYCEFFSGLGGKPSIIEEQGTFCDMTINREGAADYMRANLFSSWANGFNGYFWWCGMEHRLLNHPPYTWSMWERELGLLDENLNPKPVGLEMKRISELFETLPDLPPKKIDACCILSNGCHAWDAAANCYYLGKQAGLEITIRHYTEKLENLPDVPVYLLPDITGTEVINKELLMFLIDKAEKGATVYMSRYDAYLTDFEYMFGMRSYGFTGPAVSEATLNLSDGELKMPVNYFRTTDLQSIGAEVLGRDTEGRITFACNKVGKGKFYYLAFPMEKRLGETPMVYCKEDAIPYWRVYREMAREVIEAKPCINGNPMVAVTLHYENENSIIAVAVNYSNKEQNANLRIADGWKCEYIYGSETIRTCDMAVIRLTK